MIYYAQLYWMGTGVACTVLLSVFCYLGWWYQRHSRAHFKRVVDDVLRLGENKEEVPGKNKEEGQGKNEKEVAGPAH